MEGSFISTKTEAKKEIDLATASHHVKELFFHTMRERRKAGRIPPDRGRRPRFVSRGGGSVPGRAAAAAARCRASASVCLIGGISTIMPVLFEVSKGRARRCCWDRDGGGMEHPMTVRQTVSFFANGER